MFSEIQKNWTYLGNLEDSRRKNVIKSGHDEVTIITHENMQYKVHQSILIQNSNSKWLQIPDHPWVLIGARLITFLILLSLKLGVIFSSRRKSYQNRNRSHFYLEHVRAYRMTIICGCVAIILYRDESKIALNYGLLTFYFSHCSR